MTGLFSLTYGNIAVSALIICGIAALFSLAGQVVWYRIRVALDDHYYPPQRPVLPDGCDASRDSMEDLADSLRGYPDLDEDRVVDEDTGRHSLAMVVPPPTPQEMTGYIPVVSGADGAA